MNVHSCSLSLITLPLSCSNRLITGLLLGLLIPRAGPKKGVKTPKQTAVINRQFTGQVQAHGPSKKVHFPKCRQTVCDIERDKTRLEW